MQGKETTMKVFTADLLKRFGSEDHRVACAAEDELDRRAEEYAQKLKDIESKLPQRLQDLLNQFYLHDARVISHAPLMLTGLEWLEHVLRVGLTPTWRILGAGGDPIPSCWIPLQLNTPPKESLILQYRFVRLENAEIHESLFEECPYIEWQHDEVDLIQLDGRLEFRHSILFTRGLELRLRFKDFDFATLKPMEIVEEGRSSPGRAVVASQGGLARSGSSR
jgi:hypothetical protein